MLVSVKNIPISSWKAERFLQHCCSILNTTEIQINIRKQKPRIWVSSCIKPCLLLNISTKCAKKPVIPWDQLVVFESTFIPMDWKCYCLNSFVISRLDYCNSLLYDIPKYQRDKLQRIQNTAAQMITGARSSDHITPILRSLRWLPVEARINSNILLITYKILNEQSAGYLEPLIEECHPSRALRSSSRSLLCT